MAAITDTSKIAAFESLFRAYLGEDNHAVFLRRVEGHTLKAIAADMGISVVSVHNRMQRVKLKLAEAKIKLAPAVERML